MARRVYHWKHGWIPLTHEAALQKAHGSEAGAKKLLPMTPVAQEHLARHKDVMAGYRDGRVTLSDSRTGGSTSISQDLAEKFNARGERILGVSKSGMLEFEKREAPPKPSKPPMQEPDWLKDKDRIQSPRHADAFRNANPEYDPNRLETTVNCAKVVQAYELRRRGYDVAATHGPAGLQTRLLARMWRDSKGNQPRVDQVDSKEALEKKTKSHPSGARYHVSVVWKGQPPGSAGAHIFNAEKQQDGTMKYFDAQTGREDASSHFARVDTNHSHGIRFYRVDNAEPYDGKMNPMKKAIRKPPEPGAEFKGMSDAGLRAALQREVSYPRRQKIRAELERRS